MLEELVLKNRSYRRFDQSVRVEETALRNLIGLARMTASANNMQPLKYILSANSIQNEDIFSGLSGAAHLKEWKGPDEGEKPAAYIIILCDTSLKEDAGCDHGIAAQTIMLGAAELDLGGCMIASINRERLRRLLNLPDRFTILLVLALGKPAEKVVLETVGEDGDTRYWRDENNTHHVPKRVLDELILEVPKKREL
jgi:nitroreductase